MHFDRQVYWRRFSFRLQLVPWVRSHARGSFLLRRNRVYVPNESLLQITKGEPRLPPHHQTHGFTFVRSLNIRSLHTSSICNHPASLSLSAESERTSRCRVVGGAMIDLGPPRLKCLRQLPPFVRCYSTGKLAMLILFVKTREL